MSAIIYTLLSLRKIAYLRPLLSEEATKTLVMSFVISKLDYCNSLYFGISEQKLDKLQKIQNHAARLVKKVPKRESVTPLLKEMHWLPIRARIQYKIAVLTYQCIFDPLFPEYLKEFVTIYSPVRTLLKSRLSDQEPTLKIMASVLSTLQLLMCGTVFPTP